MDIKNVYDSIIFTSAALTIKDALIEAVKKGANLSSADLRGADLSSADLSSADLRGADLSSADLRGADLSSADLRGANLRGANLSGANLRGANLRGANLRGADLSSANLRGANLSGANLRGADLSNADLRGADLSSANLRGANLSGANLKDIKNADLTIARLQFIPTEGSFIGWKKCEDDVIVKLQIPAKAKRSHGAERKCRASEVKVLEVIGATKGISLHDKKTEYVKGEIVKADKWDEDRWNTCSNGIHFYLTREEAEAHA